jgi:hypothetical protein
MLGGCFFTAWMGFFAHLLKDSCDWRLVALARSSIAFVLAFLLARLSGATPDTLARAVEIGLLDAPHLRGNAAACGKIVTRMIGGACLAVDQETGQPLPEAERVARALYPSLKRKRREALAGAAGW